MHVDVGEFNHLSQQLHGESNEHEDKILLLFGVFHLELMLIRTVSKLAADAGFTEMLNHGGIFSSELAAQKAWGGKMYNNAVVAMRSLYELLTKDQWSAFLASLSEDQQVQAENANLKIVELFNSGGNDAAAAIMSEDWNLWDQKRRTWVKMMSAKVSEKNGWLTSTV
jgi:hypothetical protein